jgi:hypothetical protein
MIWNGTPHDTSDLTRAVARHCACEHGPMGVRVTTCSPHRMLSHDKRAVNGLLFMRRLADRLRQEEFSPS